MECAASGACSVELVGRSFAAYIPKRDSDTTCPLTILEIERRNNAALQRSDDLVVSLFEVRDFCIDCPAKLA